jgi:ABC-type protease/lipase transport system fused ATPase/permease subunit
MRRRTSSTRQNRALTAVGGAMVLIVIVLIVQMWLLTVSLELYLEEHHEAVLPAAVVSGILFLSCLGLYIFAGKVDAEVRKGSRDEL